MIKDLAKSFGLNQSEIHKVAIACYWKNGRKPSINDFSNCDYSSVSSTSTQSSFVSFKDYNQGNGGSSARASSQNCNSENTNFSNPHQKKFYKELFPLSCERGGFSFGDIQMIKDLGKSFGLNQSEIHKVAIACYWKKGRKPSMNDFSNGGKV
jgi:hypothetical protein